MSKEMNCEICKQELLFQWSDTHGVGVCCNCGLPYTIFHYEGIRGSEERRRVDKPPAVAIKAEWLPLAQRYWDETKRRVFPTSYDLGISRSGRSYSGATMEDAELFGAWMQKHKDEWPKEEEAA